MRIDNEDRIDIHRLTIKEPVKEDYNLSQLENFAQAAWKNLRPSLDTRIDVDSAFTYATDRVIEFSTLFPKKRDELKGLFTEEDLEFLEIYAKQKVITGAFGDERRIIAARKLQTLFPERFKKLNLNKEQIAWRAKDLIQPIVDGEYRGIKWTSIAGYKILFPDMDLPAIKMDDLQNIIDTYIYKEEFAGSLRVIFPDLFNDSTTGKDFLKKCIEDLKQTADIPDWAEVSLSSYYLKILLAKELKFTPEGLELIMPDKKTVDIEIPALPETKKYI